jgi:HK97 family phage major capsid protein
LTYLKENGPGEGGISATAEGALKSQIDFDLIEVTSQSNYIAGWSRVSRKFLTSVPGARNFLTNRLTEAYLSKEDDLLLNGDGISPNMLGINTAGNFTVATALAAQNDLDQLVLSVGQLSALNRTPQLIILNPDNLYQLLLNKAAGSGEYDSPAAIKMTDNGNISVAGVPVVTTTAQPLGVFTIVDRNGLLIGVSEQLNVRFFEEDGSNVRENKITIRIESAIALASFGPSYIIKGTF